MDKSQTDVYLCDMCKWKQNRYNTENVTQRNKKSTGSDNENNVVEERICAICRVEIPVRKKYVADKSENAKVSWFNIFNSSKLGVIIIIITILILIGAIYVWNSRASRNIVDMDFELKKLMQKYQNQNPELWHNVFKITNTTKSLIHVLILMHKGDGKVAECFAKDLITLVNKIIKKNEFHVVYKENTEVSEYGVELNHYLQLVRKHNHLIVLQLNKIPGDTARMFHALCDEAPSSVRPSYFIFTLEDKTKESAEVRRPLARAGHILRSAWSNLKDSELHPLISRVVRNVAEISPENLVC